MTTLRDDERTYLLLAAAMVEHPSATLHEIAIAVGVSRATLYRFVRTREELLERLMTFSCSHLNKALVGAALSEGPPLLALRRLIEGQVAHKPLLAFLTHYWDPRRIEVPAQMESWEVYEKTLDAFFLQGQQAGVFRLDVSAEALNETLTWLIVGLVDAEGRGRIPRAKLADLVETLFLNGTR